jgi:putative ABC transport system ATP-binding protein
MCLQVKNLSLTLSSGQKVLHQVAFEMAAGEFVVLMGSNGSGKSTLMKVLNRQYSFSRGSVLLNGKNIKKIPNSRYAKDVITLTQFVGESLFLDMTVFENAELISTLSSKADLIQHLKKFNSNLVKAIDRPASELSGGEQQQLAFALSLTHRPTLLLLDEHTSALDPKTAEKIMQMTSAYVKAEGITCLMTTHHAEFAKRFGDRHFVMEAGELSERMSVN